MIAGSIEASRPVSTLCVTSPETTGRVATIPPLGDESPHGSG